MHMPVKRTRRTAKRLELGEYIVADPAICHGKPTFKGTRIMVWQVLDALARGESLDDIVEAWAGRVSKEAVAETTRLARGALLDEHVNLARHMRCDVWRHESPGRADAPESAS